MPLTLLVPSSEAILLMQNLEIDKRSSIDFITMGGSGCHGGGNNLKKRKEKAAVQKELKKLFDERMKKDS